MLLTTTEKILRARGNVQTLLMHPSTLIPLLFSFWWLPILSFFKVNSSPILPKRNP